ncbi:MAG: hypothetical protein ACRD0J_06890, partial [Acidimicrobiales bacterium]
MNDDTNDFDLINDPRAIPHPWAALFGPSGDSVVSVVRSYGVSECEGAGPLLLTVQVPLPVNDQRCEGPSSETSFPYVARWSAGDPEVVRSSAERAMATARRVVEAMD